MTTTIIHRAGPPAYPNWVPQDVRHYLVHTEGGHSIRAVARAAGCHASTVLRQVRRNENRRDDPLLDIALDRLASVARHDSHLPTKDTTQMMAQNRISNTSLPDDSKVEGEARRILRRLAEPDACLAIAPGMEKAVVVRELPDGRTIRTGVLDREVAEAFVIKDWIVSLKKGKVARYGISQAGRAALKRLLVERDAEKQGFAEAPSAFGDQHRVWGERETGQTGARSSKRIRYNVIESPLAALARRKDKEGKPFLADDLVAAGERLREDFELAQMGPRVAQNWDRFLTGGDRGGFQDGGAARGPEAARDRVARALQDLGPGLGDVVLRCCCFLEGMEQAEKRMGWSARSGKIVLKIALQRLNRHYRLQGGSSGLIG
ncbi:MAG: helix-turn-helix domain-containing protein [Rhodobacter sp.]|nr:helix-turn-helix domain-containing protein [Rhodobacter sp.]